MKRVLILAAAILFFAAAMAQPAQAGPLNGLGRYLGWGWSDGYHSRPSWGHGSYYHEHPGGWHIRTIESVPGQYEYIEPIPQSDEDPLLPPAPVAPPDVDIAPGEDTWLPGTLRRDRERLLPEAMRPRGPASR